MDVEQVVGSFVVEIGFRQAWPFLGLCDNRPTPSQEARLYIDASWSIEAATFASGTVDDDILWLTAALALNGRTIDTARVGDDGSLSLTADRITLVASGEPGPNTSGEAWRLTTGTPCDLEPPPLGGRSGHVIDARWPPALPAGRAPLH